MYVSRALLTAAVFAALFATAAASPPTIVDPQNAAWKAGAGPMKGTEIATVTGNPQNAGAFYAYLIKMPAGFKVPPHFHRLKETVTVISGTVMFGAGDTMNAAAMTALGPGMIVSVPAGVHHYAMAKTDAIIEVSGIAPDTTTLVSK
jgi:quercetin dioxygenase-like cupin family protein